MDFSRTTNPNIRLTNDPFRQSAETNKLTSSGNYEIKVKRADPKLLDKTAKETKKKHILLLKELKKK